MAIVPTPIDLNDTTPVAPADAVNVQWQADALNPRHVSAYLKVTIVSLDSAVPAAGGNFQVAHGLGRTPVHAAIQMKSLGIIAFQATKWDATNIYLQASDGGLSADAEVW